MTDLDKLFQLASADTISDEMLAAYIDGNAIPLEKYIIEKELHVGNIQEVIDVIRDIKLFPELMDIGERQDDEDPDKKTDKEDVTLKELKKNIERINEFIM